MRGAAHLDREGGRHGAACRGIRVIRRIELHHVHDEPKSLGFAGKGIALLSQKVTAYLKVVT